MSLALLTALLISVVVTTAVWITSSQSIPRASAVIGANVVSLVASAGVIVIWFEMTSGTSPIDHLGDITPRSYLGLHVAVLCVAVATALYGSRAARFRSGYSKFLGSLAVLTASSVVTALLIGPWITTDAASATTSSSIELFTQGATQSAAISIGFETPDRGNSSLSANEPMDPNLRLNSRLAIYIQLTGTPGATAKWALTLDNLASMDYVEPETNVRYHPVVARPLTGSGFTRGVPDGSLCKRLTATNVTALFTNGDLIHGAVDLDANGRGEIDLRSTRARAWSALVGTTVFSRPPEVYIHHLQGRGSCAMGHGAVGGSWVPPLQATVTVADPFESSSELGNIERTPADLYSDALGGWTRTVNAQNALAQRVTSAGTTRFSTQASTPDTDAEARSNEALFLAAIAGAVAATALLDLIRGWPDRRAGTAAETPTPQPLRRRRRIPRRARR